MKTKKMLILFITLIVVVFIFIPKAYAGGGGGDYDIKISDETKGYYIYSHYEENYIHTYIDGKTRYVETNNFNEHITELNKYLPEGICFKANEDDTFDIYINNAHCDGIDIDFFSSINNWSGKLYLSGKNNLKSLGLGKSSGINIIGEGINKTTLDSISMCNDVTLKNCNINIKENGRFSFRHCKYNVIFATGGIEFTGEHNNLLLEGRTKIEIGKNATFGSYWDREALKAIIGENYNSQYEKESELTIERVNASPEMVDSYCSPEAIIIKNYEDVKLLEQSVEKINAGEVLTFRFDKEIEKFEDLYINGNLLEKDVDYTIESGSTIVKLSAEYTKTLAAGNYEVKAIFTDGEGSTTFEVLEENKVEESNTERTLDKTPKTGSKNNTYYILISVLVIITLGITLNKFI